MTSKKSFVTTKGYDSFLPLYCKSFKIKKVPMRGFSRFRICYFRHHSASNATKISLFLIYFLVRAIFGLHLLDYICKTSLAWRKSNEYIMYSMVKDSFYDQLHDHHRYSQHIGTRVARCDKRIACGSMLYVEECRYCKEKPDYCRRAFP